MTPGDYPAPTGSSFCSSLRNTLPRYISHFLTFIIIRTSNACGAGIVALNYAQLKWAIKKTYFFPYLYQRILNKILTYSALLSKFSLLPIFSLPLPQPPSSYCIFLFQTPWRFSHMPCPILTFILFLYSFSFWFDTLKVSKTINTFLRSPGGQIPQLC